MLSLLGHCNLNHENNTDFAVKHWEYLGNSASIHKITELSSCDWQQKWSSNILVHLMITWFQIEKTLQKYMPHS